MTKQTYEQYRQKLATEKNRLVRYLQQYEAGHPASTTKNDPLHRGIGDKIGQLTHALASGNGTVDFIKRH